MANKKQNSGNKPKNNTQAQQSGQSGQQDDAQVQQQLSHYSQIAEGLYNSSDSAQAEAALASITAMSEASQIALLKALSKETTTDSANVLLAMNTLAPIKEVRKEAKRSLLRLEATKTYPQWTPPQAAPAAVIEETQTPSRFWRGFFTDSRETGEMQLILCWEQGANYKEIRMIGFLLEFWHDGVKDAFVQTLSKRKAEEQIQYMRAQFEDGGIELVDCTLAQGRRLLLDALEVNKRFHTQPHSDYTRQLPLIRQLILDNPEAMSGDDTLPAVTKKSRSPILDALNADYESEDDLSEDSAESDNVIEGFLEIWSQGDYRAAYDLLSSDSPLREGLTRDEWAERREAWAEQAQPARAKIDVGYGFETDEEISDDIDDMPEELDAFWSLEMKDTPLSSTIKELPMATVVYQGTGRHWFWAGYTLVEEEDGWRISDMKDKGADAQRLSRAELELRLRAIAQEVQNLTADAREEEDEDEEDFFATEEEDEDEDEEDDFFAEEEQLEEMGWFTQQAMHYCDAILTQSPQDYEWYGVASQQAIAVQDLERAAAYFELVAERFPERRSEALIQEATILLTSVVENEEEYEDIEEEDTRFLALAEKALREAMDTDQSFVASILLANLLLREEERLDEVEQLLQQAQAAATQEAERALVEVNLARLARVRGADDEALAHYQRAAEMSPDMPSIWYKIGEIQHELHREQDAEQSYLHSIDVDPETTAAYGDLATIYAERGEPQEALGILEQGLEANPDAADLMAAMAMHLISMGDLQRAEGLIDEAEEIDPDMDVVQVMRSVIEAQKAAQLSQSRSRRPKRR